MKACADFQMELGGRQLAGLLGGGLYELGTSRNNRGSTWWRMSDVCGMVPRQKPAGGY